MPRFIDIDSTLSIPAAATARLALRPQVFDARDYGVIADGAEHNNVANMLDCVEACKDAGGGTVLLPAGIIVTSEADIGTVTADSGNAYTNNGGIPIPVDTPITIQGHGTGVTVMKLSVGFTRAFDFWHVADGQNYADVHLRGFTVDRDDLLGVDVAAAAPVTSNVTLTGSGVWTTLPGVSATTFKNAQYIHFLSTGSGTAANRNLPARISGSNVQVYNAYTDYTVVSGDTVHGGIRGHVIVGTNCGIIGAGTDMTFDNITVENVEAINVAESYAASLGAVAPNRSLGIDMFVTPSVSPAQVPKVTNFTARNVKVDGGAYGIQVVGNEGCFLDNIWFIDCWHDTGIDVVNNWNSSNFIIGGSAWLNKCGVVRCTGRRTGDVGVEFDQPWDAYEIDCVWEDGYQAVYTTTFTPPARTEAGPPTCALDNGGTLSDVAATCTVSALPDDVERQGLVQIGSELLWYEATNAAGTEWDIYRAMNGSTAASHADASTVTFIETSRTRIHSVRSSVRNSNNVNNGRCWTSFTNSNYPLPPLTIRDPHVTLTGGTFSFVRAGSVGRWDGWCPEIDIEGARISHSGLDITVGSGQLSAFATYSVTAGMASVPCPAPKVVGRNNKLIVHGAMSSALSFAAWHQRDGMVGYDFDIDADLSIGNASNHIGAYLSNGVVGPGSRIGVTLETPSVTGSIPVSVGSSTYLTISDFLFLDIDASRMRFPATATDSNYRPWSIDATNADKVIISSVLHSGDVSNSYPTMSPSVVKTTSDYTVLATDDIILVDTTSAPVEITLPISTGGGSGLGKAFMRGKQVTIIDYGPVASINAITVTPAATDKIDAASAGTSLVINKDRSMVTFTADNAKPGWITNYVPLVTVTGTELRLGVRAYTATSTPDILNLGGTFPTNTAGTAGNLKLVIYENVGSSYFGIGLSAAVMEYQVPATNHSHKFYVAGVEKFTVSNTAVTALGYPVGIKVSVPASATAAGSPGQWAADSSWIYVCTATNTWVRAALATW